MVDINGVLLAGDSPRAVYGQLSTLEIPEGTSFSAMDATGQVWSFVVLNRKGVLSPLTGEKPRTKLQLIQWFNRRMNKPDNEPPYPETSLSSKTRDRIIADIMAGLLAAS